MATEENDAPKGRTMAKELKSALTRSSDTILMDALGVVALGVILFVGLSMPAMV